MLAIPLTSCGGAGVEDAPTAPTPANDAAPWPRPTDPLERAQDAGLEPATVEFLVYHVHAHLDVFVNGNASRRLPRSGSPSTTPRSKELDSEIGPGWGGSPRRL